MVCVISTVHMPCWPHRHPTGRVIDPSPIRSWRSAVACGVVAAVCTVPAALAPRLSAGSGLTWNLRRRACPGVAQCRQCAAPSDRAGHGPHARCAPNAQDWHDCADWQRSDAGRDQTAGFRGSELWRCHHFIKSLEDANILQSSLHDWHIPRTKSGKLVINQY